MDFLRVLWELISNPIYVLSIIGFYVLFVIVCGSKIDSALNNADRGKYGP